VTIVVIIIAVIFNVIGDLTTLDQHRTYITTL